MSTNQAHAWNAPTADPQGNDRTAYTSAFPSSRDPQVDNAPANAGKKEKRSTPAAPTNVGETERWLSLSVGAGLFLEGLKEGKVNGLLTALAGGAMILRGVTGYCSLYHALGMNTAKSETTTVSAQAGFRVEQKINIHRSPDEIYRFWRNFENLPQIMDHLREVKSTGGDRSHWIAATALGDIAWDAEIFNERENELIAWRSLPGSIVDTAGTVRFNLLHPSGHTEVVVSLKYNPPLGALGAQIESWLGGCFEKRLAADLRRFKETMESGSREAPSELAATGV